MVIAVYKEIAEEDDFFDAQESFVKDSAALEAHGRLKPFGTLCLLHFPDRQMYEPVTQVLIFLNSKLSNF